MRYRLYWIHNDRETDPLTEGYVGVTTHSLKARLYQHQIKSTNYSYTQFIPEPEDKIKLLETHTSRKVAYQRENEMRPEKYIGRNIAAGGEGGGRGKKSPEHRRKIGEKKKAWWDSPEGLAKKKEFSEKMKGNPSNTGIIPVNAQPCKINRVIYHSVRTAAEELGIHHNTIRYRISVGRPGYEFI
tara:strand:- start:47 stop:601 length:555 start_codon:yes stop_codon:yes gene_type:complete